MSERTKLPLSPMLVQYLVGLCTLKWNADAGTSLTVTIGDMVHDAASDSRRDLDVTVTLDTVDGVYAFMGYEVKHETANLDQSAVEGLVAKLNDMPAVTHRAIVCTSGFSKTAVKKAEHHGVDLYVIKEWTKPVEEQFPNLAPMKGAPAAVFGGGQFLLNWVDWSTWLTVGMPDFEIGWKAPLFDARGKEHPLYSRYGNFVESVLLQSTDILHSLPLARERLQPLVDALAARAPLPNQPPWPYAHTIDVSSRGIYLRSPENELHRFDALTIHGELRWKYSPFLYLAMEKVPTGEIFTSAIVGVSPVPGRMQAIIIPTTGRTLDIRDVVLDQNQLNLIRNLTLLRDDYAPST